MRLHTDSTAQTLALGHLLGRLAPAPPALTRIALDGPLGAGKTLLTRGIARGARVGDEALVCSPTYVLMNIYNGPKPVRHFDAYRAASPQAFTEIGFEEMVRDPGGGGPGGGNDGGGIVVVEWASRVAELLPADTLWIALAHAEPPGSGADRGAAAPSRRSFTFTAGGPAARELLRKLDQAIRKEGGEIRRGGGGGRSPA